MAMVLILLNGDRCFTQQTRAEKREAAVWLYLSLSRVWDGLGCLQLGCILLGSSRDTVPGRLRLKGQRPPDLLTPPTSILPQDTGRRLKPVAVAAAAATSISPLFKNHRETLVPSVSFAAIWRGDCNRPLCLPPTPLARRNHRTLHPLRRGRPANSRHLLACTL